LFATRHPELVSHLILEGPYLRGDDIFQESLVGSVRQMRRHDFDFWIETIHRALGIAPEFLPNFLAVFHELGPNGMDALDDFTATIDLTKILPEVRVPTLVLGFDQPGGISATMSAEVAALIPAAEFASGPNPYSGLDAARASIVEPLSRFLGLPDGSSAGPRSSTFRTILFTDVVASTPLLTQLRDQRMREVMRDHDAVMEAAVTGHGGRVVKTIGDAFMAEFAVPSAAVEAAIEAQRQIREKFAASDVPVRLRIGINAGEPIEEAGDLHGASVVIAKRLESAAETNGILVSDVVKQMVTGKDFDFEDRGLVELKGFEEPVRAWTVRWE
jgi:class 3 adenylate cyclase